MTTKSSRVDDVLTTPVDSGVVLLAGGCGETRSVWHTVKPPGSNDTRLDYVSRGDNRVSRETLVKKTSSVSGVYHIKLRFEQTRKIQESTSWRHLMVE